MLKSLGENDLVWSKDVDSGKLYTDVLISQYRDKIVSRVKEAASSDLSMVIKIILLLGIRRKNVEDLLIACDLINTKNGAKADFRDEIKILREVIGAKDFSS
jgi:hypothetical protein